MTERDLQDAVIETARLLGWKVAHFRPAQTRHGWRTPVQADGAGWPDLILVHPAGAILARELKAGTGRLTPAQQAWLDLLEGAGVDAGVWTDKDWQAGRVEAELQAATRNRKEAA